MNNNGLMKIMVCFLLIIILNVNYSCAQIKNHMQMNPKEMTIEFIKDYKIWNDYAYEIDTIDKKDGTEKAKNAYHNLILKYCRPNLKYQNIAFGSDSNHDLAYEKIVSSEIKNDSAIIKTKYIHDRFSYIHHDFEYVYIIFNDRWFLEHVYLVDEFGKYEGL